MAGQSAAVLHSEAKIRIRPLNGFIGAEIEGADLRHPLTPAAFKIVHGKIDYWAQLPVPKPKSAPA